MVNFIMALFKNNFSNKDSNLKNDINHLLEMAVAEHQNGQLHSAEIKYLKALEIDSDHLAALQLSGLLAFQLQNYQCAIERLSWEVPIAKILKFTILKTKRRFD